MPYVYHVPTISTSTERGIMTQPSVEVTVSEEAVASPPETVESDATEAVEIETLLSLTERVTRVEERVSLLESATVATVEAIGEVAQETAMAQDTAEFAVEIAADAETAAYNAQDTADTALAESEAVIDAAVDTESDIGEELIVNSVVEPDTPANRSHWLFRPMSEWRGK